jgi:hypothetical protein
MHIKQERQYFGSWTGYDPPIRPLDPIDYGRAEASGGFSVFEFDESGRVVTFEKWVAVRERIGTPAAVKRLAPGAHYFRPSKDVAAEPGDELALEETKPLAEYYHVLISEDGAVTTERVHRERTIRHEYIYWDSGALREARYVSSSGSVSSEHFGRDGKLIRSH